MLLATVAPAVSNALILPPTVDMQTFRNLKAQNAVLKQEYHKQAQTILRLEGKIEKL
jgi:hypothetical protein